MQALAIAPRTGATTRLENKLKSLPTATLPCHNPVLANILPNGGWPESGITELMVNRLGCGEVKLLLPRLADVSRQGKQIILIAPPSMPNSAAWKMAGIDPHKLTCVSVSTEHDALKAMEAALGSQHCGAVVGWFRHALADSQAFAIQLAAEVNHTQGFILRQAAKSELQNANFSLRLSLESVAGGVAVQVMPRRGSLRKKPTFIAHRHQH